MHSIIKILETLGSTASFSVSANNQLLAVINPLDMDVEVQQAILQRDVEKLEALLDVRQKIVCMINQPEPEDIPLEQPEPEEEDKPIQSMACF